LPTLCSHAGSSFAQLSDSPLRAKIGSMPPWSAEDTGTADFHIAD
jgi:hypothetical protein